MGLCIHRRIGEKIMIGDSIVVTVIKIGSLGGRPYATLNVTAPDDVRIDREEVHLNRKAEQGDSK